jgi:hypothetical protein
LTLKKQKTWILTLAIASLFSTVVHASDTQVGDDTMHVKKSYRDMSTSALEQEVEKLTLQGNVPFEMGLELMNRWTKGSAKGSLKCC